MLCISRVKRRSIWKYQSGELSDYLQITLALPGLLKSAYECMSRGINIPGIGHKKLQCYEMKLAFPLRFMVDMNLRGGGWVELPKSTYFLRVGDKETHCQLELTTHFDTVIGHDPEGQWLRMAPMRILSFDIECSGREGHFPQTHTDPIIQIANVVSLQSSPGIPIIKNIFTLNGCSAIAGVQVISNSTEKEMLIEWLRFFIQVDPDIITGYNIVNFDLPYLLDRATALKLVDFPFFGRIKDARSAMKNVTFQSNAFGTRVNKNIKIDGRIQFDVLCIIRREFKLRSYSLNSVCAEYLQSQKEDVHYSIISQLQNGTDVTRRRLAVYCIKVSTVYL